MPKRHILARNRVVWGITRENRFGALAVECWKNPEKRSRVNHLWCAISYAIFCDDRLTGLGVARGRISHFPIDLCRRPYYILARLKTLPSVRKRHQQHHGKEYTKQQLCKNASLFGSICDTECCRYFSTVYHLTHHALMKWTYYVYKLLRTSDFQQNLPKLLPCQQSQMP